MQPSKLIVLIFAFLALIFATVQANPASSEEDEKISDRRFRWVGSNEVVEQPEDSPQRGNNEVSHIEIIESDEWVPANQN